MEKLEKFSIRDNKKIQYLSKSIGKCKNLKEMWINNTKIS